MSERAFYWSLAGIGMLILLSIPEATGAMMGVFFGFGIAFFVASTAWIINAALQPTGLAPSFESLMIGFATLYGLMVLGLALCGWVAFRRRRPDAARVLTAKAALFAALAPMAYFSLNAMQAAWP